MLDPVFVQQLPNLTIPTTSPALHRALELWFLSPQLVIDITDPLMQPSSLVATKSDEDGPAAPKSDEDNLPCSDPACSGSPSDEGGPAAPKSAEQPLVPSAPIEIPNSQTLNSPAINSQPPPGWPLDIPLWPEPVDGKQLLDSIVQILKRFVVLPPWASETLALWIVHTYAFQLRDVSTYIGIESPEPRCGKTTLLTVLNALAYRAIPSANISPPALFRVIEDMCPTLLIDEADTFLHRNEQLQGIFNSGYKRDTAFVWRVACESNPSPPSKSPSADSTVAESESQIESRKSKIENGTGSQLARFSCWCPKAISQIGRLPRTLADRCIVIRMQRKTPHEQCDRLRDLKVDDLKSQCARFVTDHQQQIAAARPPLPETLGDRAADIWEPLFALADLAGEAWGGASRNAALSLAAAAHDSNPIAALLTDICIEFFKTDPRRIFSRDLVATLNLIPNRPWAELLRGKPMTDLWLSDRLRPYGIRPRNITINSVQAKGYLYSDCEDVFRRYLTRADLTQRTGIPEDPAPTDSAKTDRPAA